jgi:L,D-peptidoglycan transpeptidase YkuD (ErfK/YbiS/YcfS/YnhG family)
VSQGAPRRAALRMIATMFTAPFLLSRARAAPFDLVYSAGRLNWPGGSTRAAIGKAGVRADKREGDLATPAGDFPLLQGFYRPDRVAPPPTGLPMRALQPNDAWVDDPADPRYNSLVKSPYPAHVEPLWRKDGIYDLIVVIGYNMSPTKPGLGSAIFLHIARESYSPTVGCVAISRAALLGLLPRLSADSRLRITR